MKNIWKDRKGVVYIWFVAIAGLALTAIVWYIMNSIIQATITNIYNMYPLYFDEGTVIFLRDFWSYMLAIIVLACYLVWIYMTSQKKRPEEYVYV